MESVQGLGGQDLASRLDKRTISRGELPRIKKEMTYEKMTRVKNSNLDGNTLLLCTYNGTVGQNFQKVVNSTNFHLIWSQFEIQFSS